MFNYVKSAFLAGSLAVTALYGVIVPAQTRTASPKELVQEMIVREQGASHDTALYSYLSEERSERTGGHLWKERMVETAWGTVRYLLAVDGKPLTAEQSLVEQSRLRFQTSNPASYRREELKLDESEHSQQMLALLPKAFLFELQGQDAQEIRIGYRPDPAFMPQTMEERALYGMTGVIVLDGQTLRLHQLEGRASKDVSLGFGPFATLHAGSNFATDREHIDGAVWRTASVTTSIQGKAMLLKTIARLQEYQHADFRRLPIRLTLSEAVDLAERQ